MKIFALFFFIYIPSLIYAQNKENFRVFDAMMIKGKPDLFDKGLSYINMIYDDSILAFNDLSDLNASEFSLNKYNKIRNYVKPNYPICLDIEVWLFEKKYIKKSVSKYTQVLKKFKKDFPKSNIGLYGVIPYADLNIYQGKAPYINDKSRDWKFDWEYINRNLGSIIPNSDIAYPSCYTRFKYRDLWTSVFIEQIRKIKEIDPNKKIYAFIWPQYYSPGFGYNDSLVEADFWLFQLEMLYKYCDGAVIWAPPFNLSDRSDYFWNENADWWKITKQFIKDKKIQSNYANK